MERIKWRSNSHNKTSMQRRLYSGHLSVADIILSYRLEFPPRKDLPIVDTAKNESQKKFL